MMLTVIVQTLVVVPFAAVTVYVAGAVKFRVVAAVGLMLAPAEIVKVVGVTAVKGVPDGTFTAIVPATLLIVAEPI